MQSKKKILVVSSLVALAAAGLAVGGTFALFTSNVSDNVSINAGKVSVSSTLALTAATSGEEAASVLVDASNATFQNGGTAKVDGTTVTLDKMTPMDSVTVNLTPVNNSNVKIKYRLLVTLTGDLAPALKFYVDGTAHTAGVLGEWTELDANAAFPVDAAKAIKIELPKETGNYYQDMNAIVSISLQAVQGNAPTGYKLDTAAKTLDILDEAGMVYMNQNATSLLDYSIKLSADVDMGFMDWVPFAHGNSGNGSEIKDFVGSFDGGSHVIKNLNIYGDDIVTSSPAYGYGFFSSIAGTASVKNVTFDNANGVALTWMTGKAGKTTANIVGIVAGYAKGTNTLENVKVYNSIVGGYGKVGGLVGMATGSQQTVTNCTVSNLTRKGTYDVGGLYGLVQRKAAAETITITGSTVSGLTDKKGWPFGGTYRDFTGEIANFYSDDTTTGTMVEKAIKGNYWQNGDYYWGGFANQYVSHGNSGADGMLKAEPTKGIAQCEIVFD